MELEEAIEILKDYLCKTNSEFCKVGAVGIPNKEYFAIETVLKHLTKQEKMIDEIKSKLEEHIQHCKQEARGSLHNEICHISLKFDETLLNIIENKAEEVQNK